MKPIPCCIGALLLASLPLCAQNTFFPYLNQRTLYLENLLTPGAWWSNPAILSDVANPTLLIDNVTPLSQHLTIASVKVVLPHAPLTYGLALLGTGLGQLSQLSYDPSSGAQYQSSFSFDQPYLQGGAACSLGKYGAIGLTMLGSVQHYDTMANPSQNPNYYYTLG
ncbi:MAG: hypothetical protein PHC61_15265, partial [Chitinivibrionales bacterium]|nr:hypothetical protein [Chitinivibrionales bacterium]